MTRLPKLLIVGRTGQLATDLAESCASARRPVACLGRPHLNLADLGSIERALAQTRPDVVINAAAYTAVDKAEIERDDAFAINAVGPGHLARACARARLPLIQVSTDMVFPDRAVGEHGESDPVAPLSHYGATKLEGERRVASAGGLHLIVRTSWVFSPNGDNFVKKIIQWASTRSELPVVADQRGRPTYSPALAAALVTLADRMADDTPQSPKGLLHLAGADILTRAEQARRIMTASALRGGPSATIVPVPTSAFPTPAPRALNATLCVALALHTYGLTLGAFDDHLAPMLNRILGAPRASQ